MVEYRGNTYQTGNATPNDARKVLKALVRAGAANGSISKGANYGDLARAELEEIYSILSNRRSGRVRVDKVANNTDNSENE